MRFLHTGDWHVGKTLRGRSRADEHRGVLAEIAQIASDHEADFVLVAGDLFDTAAPSPESDEIVYRALLDLAATGASVIVISGNHDNPRRLAAVRPLLDLTHVHAAPEVSPPDRGGVLEIEARSGGRARIALLPFLSQRGIVRADDLMRDEAAEHSGKYADRAARILRALCESASPETVNVVLAHAMVHGGLVGGGERSAHTVFDYSIPTEAFGADLHYVALGHLHRPQSLPGGCPVRYCGSPLQLDFGEVEDDKSVCLVEAEAGRPARIETVPLRSGRRLRRVRLPLEELEARAAGFGDDFLCVELEQPPEPGLADRVRSMLPNAVDVRILRRSAEGDERPTERRLGRSPQELFAEYLSDQGADGEDTRRLFGELLEEVQAPCSTGGGE